MTEPLRKDGWWRVAQSGPIRVFGVYVSREGKVTDAAPIARWAVGKDWVRVHRYFRRKGARLSRLKYTEYPPF